MIAVPDYHSHFHSNFHGCSLPFVLFNLAPPSVALGMLEQKFITDLNELSEKNVSLLALKASQNPIGKNEHNLPTWQDFEAHGENVWNAAGITGGNTPMLLASMIFQGANPWNMWDLENHNGSDSFFSLMCLQDNVKLINLLCTHPSLPSISEIEGLRVNAMVEGDHTYYNSKSRTVPLLHYLANKGNTEIMDVLFKLGYNPNLKDENGRTALFYIKQPSIAKYLIEKKASVSVKDNNSVGVAEFWASWLSTAAKKADLNAVVVEQLKESMTIAELQDLQKPSLLNELLNGTKTTFMSILRKGKFKSNVEFNTSSGALNLLTAALLRTDEKCEMFVKSFDQTGVSWSHTSWPNHPRVTNALVAQAIPFAGQFASAAQILANQYGPGKADFSQYQYDLVSTYQALGETDIGVQRVFKSMLYALNYGYYQEHSKSQTSSYNYNSVVPHDFAGFAKNFELTSPFKESISLMDQNNAPSALRAVLYSCLKNGERVQNLYINTHQFTHFLKDIVDRSEKSSDWARTLPYMLRLIVTQQWKDKNWDPLLNKMISTADIHSQAYLQEDLEILKPIAEVDNIAVSPLISAMQKGMILNGIENMSGVSEAPTTRRKM